MGATTLKQQQVGFTGNIPGTGYTGPPLSSGILRLVAAEPTLIDDGVWQMAVCPRRPDQAG